MTPSGAEVGDVRTVIDGQQRLTTLMIFFKFLYLMLDNIGSFDRSFRLENGESVL